jgi:hypothetical protein
MEALSSRSDFLIPMATSSLLRVEFLRLLRDVKTLLLLLAIFGTPPLAALGGGSVAKLLMFTALFLPVAIGWSWGADVASGRLIQLAVSRYSSTQLLFSRVVLFGGISILAGFIVALFSGTPSELTVLLLLFTLHIVLLGFFLCTWLRSAEVGWLPIFAALVAVWLPMLSVMKKTGGAIPQRWLRWLTAVLLPQFATELSFYSPRQLMLISGYLFVLWSILAFIAILRPDGLDRND